MRLENILNLIPIVRGGTTTRDWLKNYINSNRVVRVRTSRVDWESRDVTLSLELIAARDELMSLNGKPVKITKSSLVRMVRNDHGFLRNPSNFPESSRVISDLLETEHDYQVRKIIWAINLSPQSKCNSTTVLLRVAGIRVRCISDFEIRKLVEESGYYLLMRHIFS